VLAGEPFAAIARAVGVKTWSVKRLCGKLYREHGVHGRVELAKKLGSSARQPMQKEALKRMRVLQLMMRGWSTRRVAKGMGIKVGAVRSHQVKLYKRLGVHGRAELMEKLEVSVKETREHASKGARKLRVRV
jgi:DNA-binding CsgD family transcriptional regulator